MVYTVVSFDFLLFLCVWIKYRFYGVANIN